MHCGARGGGIPIPLTLTGWSVGMVQSFASARALVTSIAPTEAILALRPERAQSRARAVRSSFAGDVLYAVKCNDHPVMLWALYEGGITGFDVASLDEIERVRAVAPESACHYMNPVKSAESIDIAYRRHRIRRFAFDHRDELSKIVQMTDGAADLELMLRIAVPGDAALLSLSGKFGAYPEEAPALLRAARRVGREVGITFHVGSQCTSPHAFAEAIRIVGEIVAVAGPIDHLDVGGGFPALYVGDEPTFEAYAGVIEATAAAAGLTCALQCEPGRALVADCASAIARVELRKRNQLFLNDGVYNNLAELKWLGPCFPMNLVRPSVAQPVGFDLFGPTCDSIDSMPGPHWLPADVAAHDYVEIGMLGAYSSVFRTRFNGLGSSRCVILDDAGPLTVPAEPILPELPALESPIAA